MWVLKKKAVKILEHLIDKPLSSKNYSLAIYIFLLAAMAIVGVYTILSSMAATTSPAIGVHLGWTPDAAARLPGYESWLGKPVDIIGDFSLDDHYLNMEYPNFQADTWCPSWRTNIDTCPVGKKLLYGYPIIPNFKCDNDASTWYPTCAVTPNYPNFPAGGSWAVAKTGAYDNIWKNLAKNMVTRGQNDAIIRIAWEFNGNWFHHQVRNNEQEKEDFVASFRRFVDIMRATPCQDLKANNNVTRRVCPQFTFEYSMGLPGTGWAYDPMLPPNPSAVDPKQSGTYPGDAWVDYIGNTLYDGNFGGKYPIPANATPEDALVRRTYVFNDFLHCQHNPSCRGLEYMKSFATAHNKTLGFSELGLRLWKEGDGKNYGGGDNDYFLQQMYNFMTDSASRVSYFAFWENPKVGVYDSDTGREIPVPNARAAYLRLWGGSKYSRGDLNNDGKVDIVDLSKVLSNYGKTGAAATGSDPNADSRVDITDLSIVLSNYGK